MVRCSGIGVEDVHLNFCTDAEEFCPSAVPRLRDARTKAPAVIGSRHPLDTDPLSCAAHRDGDRTSGELQPTEIEPCVPQLLGQVREPRPHQNGAGSRAAFAVDSNILRGVQAGVVLRRGARLLSSAAGSEATYLLSRPTDHLEAFISHNWSVGRSKKWLALCLHFNFLSAMFCGVLTAAVLCVASSFGCLPLPATENPVVKDRGIYSGVCGFLVFHMVLLFGSDVMPSRFMRSRDVFLDKACIHQVDRTLQRRGIESLGGFLFYSWSMVVLYAPVYTTKVWTVYEMACFLSVHPGGRLVWLPVDVGPVVVALSFLAVLARVSMWAMSVVSIREWIAVPGMLFLLFLITVCCTFIFLTVVRDQVKSEADLRLFSIRNAVCTVEGDRAVVEGNVASLMRALKLAPLDSTHEQALRAFDLMVRTTMPRAIRDSVGRAGLRYELVVTVFASEMFGWFDHVAALVSAASSVRSVVANLLYSSTLTCAVLPLCAALAMNMYARCTNLRGLKGIVVVLFVGAVAFLWIVLWFFVGSLLLPLVEESLFAFVFFCLASATLLCLTLLVFWRPPGQQRRRRTGAAPETTEQLAEALGSHIQQIGGPDVRRGSPE